MHNFKKDRYLEILELKIKHNEYLTQAELHGNLKFMSLGTIISINCNENRSVRLEINRGNEFANIYLHNGNIVHASYDNSIGEEAFFKILALKEGSFSIFPDEKIPQVSIHKNWSTLLLEGTRMMDEHTTNNESQIDWLKVLESDRNGERSSDEHLQKMIKIINGINGVQGVNILAPNLALIMSESNVAQEENLDYIRAMIIVAQTMGSFLGARYLKHLQSSSAQYIFVINKGHDFIVISTDNDIIPEILLEQIYTILNQHH